MTEDERLYSIRSLLSEYVRSPSLRHIRDPLFLAKLAKDILRTVDRGSTPWQKWDAQREALLTAAATTWIPIQDLRNFFNKLPGPKLTVTDVEQRLRMIQEEGFGLFPKDELRDACLTVYERECRLGTEMTAIIYALQEYEEEERERLRLERDRQWKLEKEREREAACRRLLSGADCKWTPLTKSAELFCRVNRRLFRLTQDKDKKCSLERVKSVDDSNGIVLGKYRGRGDATKAIGQIAYQPES